jgi:hypothetical protein
MWEISFLNISNDRPQILWKLNISELKVVNFSLFLHIFLKRRISWIKLSCFYDNNEMRVILLTMSVTNNDVTLNRRTDVRDKEWFTPQRPRDIWELESTIHDTRYQWWMFSRHQFVAQCNNMSHMSLQRRGRRVDSAMSLQWLRSLRSRNMHSKMDRWVSEFRLWIVPL